MVSLPFLPGGSIRGALIGRVRAVFNDRARGETPVVRSANALFPSGSVIWRVHGDVTTMMVGGVTALLLQMLHPSALAGIWDHSTFRDDMLGRLRRTARFIAVTTFADRSDALAAIDHVKEVHGCVKGVRADGLAYSADDPALLAWVHVAEALCFLDAWIRYGEPEMSAADQDQYFAQFATIAEMLGADPVPCTRAQAEALIADTMPSLTADARTHEVARLVLDQPAPSLAAAPVQKMVMSAAVDLLPAWARHMHALPTSTLSLPLVRLSTRGVAGTLRWAFSGQTRPASGRA